MKSFIQLKKNCKKDSSDLKQHKLAILGDCATQHLATALKGYAYEFGYSLNVFDADYNQILAQIMDPSSELYESSPESVLFFLCTEKLQEQFYQTEPEKRSVFAEEKFTEILSYWDTLDSKVSVHIMQFLFLERDDMVFGSFAAGLPVSFLYQVRKLNFLLTEEAGRRKNIFLIDLNQIGLMEGDKSLHDSKMYYVAKMPLSTEILPLVAKRVIEVIVAMKGQIKKCVVLDLDNTLWGGVIGDDGMEGIQIGELGVGHAFEDLQRWLKELKNRGIILAVCSKNNEDTAKEPFEKHPEMVLRLDDISMFVANWEDKASNIRMIQQTLNIGMDSMVFLDDNPFERNLVRSMIPEITVPELPEDPAEYLTYLKGLNLFETVSYSKEDGDRTKQYQAEIGRVSLQKQYESFEDYLKSLEMKAVAEPFDNFHYARIAQLTQRSNQFNLRTVRYTEADIARIAEDNKYITIYYTLEDKFGDHGLISVIIMEKMDEKTLFLDTWLMSCRVLKRGMEEFIINKVIETAKDAGYEYVIGEYIKTPKNAMVEYIYEKMGFEPKGENRYEADVKKFDKLTTYIVDRA